MWAEIGRVTAHLNCDDIAVFFIHTHQEAEATVQNPTIAWEILGNAAADELVPLAALEVGLDGS
eukprot:9071181-Pyramimonas_sp.AAC.1